MIDILLLEWINICEHFIKDYQSQHKWNERQCFLIIWSGILSSKYLNSTLIEKYIEILPKLSIENKRSVCNSIQNNPALTMEMVLAYPELEWKCNFVSSKYMNIADILDHPELKWDWTSVSQNLSVTMNIVLSNIDKPWNWGCLSGHRNITMSDIESHMDLAWVWNFVSWNPNETMTMISHGISIA